jgi:hypothetical protein
MNIYSDISLLPKKIASIDLLLNKIELDFILKEFSKFYIYKLPEVKFKRLGWDISLFDFEI